MSERSFLLAKYKKITDKITPECYIISDTHFEHENLLKYEPIRRKLTLKENKSIDEIIADNWNSIINEETNILHLGDFVWKNLETWSNMVSGKKILILGNHDREKKSRYRKFGWKLLDYSIIDIKSEFDLFKNTEFPKFKEMTNFLIKDMGKTRIMFSHLPVYNDTGYDAQFEEVRQWLEENYLTYECDYNIHGHVHSNTIGYARCFNASIENIDFFPIKISEVLNNLHKLKL